MKKILLLFALLCARQASAQTFFPMREGATLEYNFKDAKGRPVIGYRQTERFIKLTVDRVIGDTLANVTIDNEILKEWRKEKTWPELINALSYGDVLVGKDNIVFDNIYMFFKPAVLFLYPKSTFEVELNSRITLPRALSEGTKPADVQHRATYTQTVIVDTRLGNRRNNGLNASNMEKLLARDVRHDRSARTHCGSTYYDVWDPETGNVSFGFEDNEPPAIEPWVDYYSPEVGLVRREKLNSSGRKAEEIMELFAIEN